MIGNSQQVRIAGTVTVNIKLRYVAWSQLLVQTSQLLLSSTISAHESAVDCAVVRNRQSGANYTVKSVYSAPRLKIYIQRCAHEHALVFIRYMPLQPVNTLLPHHARNLSLCKLLTDTNQVVVRPSRYGSSQQVLFHRLPIEASEHKFCNVSQTA